MVAADSNTVPATIAAVQAFLASAREQAKDGLSWSEFGRLLVQLLNMIVRGLEAVTTMSGAEKKSIAITAAATLFDTFADRCVPLAAYPAWVIIRPAIRLLVLSLASGAVEALLRISRSDS